MGDWVDTRVDRVADADVRILLSLLVGSPVAWPRQGEAAGLVDLIGKNRLIGEVASRLAASDNAPLWLARALSARTMLIAHTNDVKSQAALLLGEAFARHGVDCVVCKGFHLAHAVYGRSSDRPFGDLDLLVRVQDRTAAERILLSEGYQVGLAQTGRGACETSFLKALTPSLTLDVDLHWKLVGPLSLVREMRLDIDSILSRSKPGKVGIRFPSTEDALVIAAVNLVRHGFRPLGNILDFRELIRLADPELLVARANAARARTALSAGLSLAAALFQADVPTTVRTGLALPRWQRAVFRRLLRPAELARYEGANDASARYVLKVLAQDGAIGVARTALGLPSTVVQRWLDAAP